MKTSKSKKCMVSNSENFNPPRVVSNSNLNQQFWHSLKDTINTKKENQSIKGRIFTAKRILTPIIQQLMKDALEQIDSEDVEEAELGKEVKVLYNNVEAKDIWHVQADHGTDGEEWAMRILREISQDFEQPFDKLHKKVDENGTEDQQSPKDILLNKRLLTKMVAIHQHLGNIIERLKEKCITRKSADVDRTSSNYVRNQAMKAEIHKLLETAWPAAGKPLDSVIKSYNLQSLGVSQPNDAFPTQRKYSRSDERGKMLRVENACSPINLDNVEKAGFSVSQKLLYDVGVSYHTLFEENKNDIGNKEIVIKCLEDLEKVRTYLESLRDDKECEKPKFSDLESCKNYECLESQPHLHSKHHNVPMVLKLNRHAEQNERNSDLIIGIPSLTSSTPDVHILLNTKDQQVDIKQATERADRAKNQNKTSYRISRIPKPVDNKRRGELGSFASSNSMRITLENMETSRRKAANLLIFDPDDPCNSIIKMKEQKNEELNDSRSVVSSTSFSLKYQEILIVEIIFCCVGGKITRIMLNIGLCLLAQRVHKPCNSRFKCLHITKMYKLVLICHYPLPGAKTMRAFHLIIKLSDMFRFYVEKNCIWTNTYEPLTFDHKGFLDNYISRILNFTSSIKGPLKGRLEDKNKCLQKNIHQHIFDSYTPKEGTIHEVYFFECFKETEKKENCSAQKKWNEKSQNVAAYPVWTIKRSKYYSVPQTKNVNEVVERQVEETEHQGDAESLKLEGDSLEEVVEPIKDNEIQMQVSQVSVLSMELSKEVESDADIDNVPKKKEIRRKVSFRDEVDISGFERNNSEDRNLDTEEYQNYPESPECEPNFYEDVNYTLEKSPSLDLQEDAKKLTSRISDLLMTDSLMQMAEVIPNTTEKLKSSMKKRSVKNLNLTESARQVLAKLSRSFVDGEYTKNSGIISIDLVPQFYDQEGNPITEIRNYDGDVLFKLYNNNVDELNSVLFDSEGAFLKNRYDANGKRIKAVYDADGRIIRRISQNIDDIKSIQTELENVEYYDYKGKPIKQLYDPSGYEIKTVGKDLTSKIFDADGRLHKNIYTRKGRRIDAVFDSHGRLIGKTSNSQLEPVVRSEIRVAKMDGDSLNKLFEGENKPEKIEKTDNDNRHKRERSPKRLFDQEGNPLIGVYDKKGKPIKLTSSGEADELLPFLFDDKGKLQSKRFDSKGKELKAVFGEDGKAISEMSIAWLNELLANSKLDSPKTKKKGSFFKRNPKSKTRPEKLCDIEKLYDSQGKVITSIFDSKGKPLVVSTSGDANKLLPFLFDSGGKFVRKSYDSEKRKLRCVYGKDGNVINSISVTYLQRIAAKLDKEQNELNEDNNQKKEDEENVSSPKVSQEKVENEEAKSSHSLDCFEKVPDQLFDQDGDILTEIFDGQGNVLAASSSGNAWKLLPHLFDRQGQFLKNRFDKKKRELSAVYNKQGDNLNDDLSSVIKITVAKSSAYNDQKEDSDEKPEEEESRNEMEKEKNCENNLKDSEYNKIGLKSEQKESNSKLPKTVSFISSGETPSKINVTSSNPEQVEPVGQKGKHDKKQLKPTTSITEKQSINQKFDRTEVSLKAGESIFRFYDERGNAITEVYDSKGRKLIRTRSEDVEQLSKYLFDKKGFLFENIYDRKGRKITHIFDDKKREISRISIPSIISGDNISSRHHEKNEKIPGSVYDKHGNLVKKIYDKKGHPLMITKLAKLEDLAPIIFDEKGVRRRIFDKSGNEIGSVYDYKGNELKRFSTSKKPKSASDCRETRIFSKSGRPLRNFYDSEGTLIIALYNDYGKTLCSVRKGVDNVEKLSKFFFDKEGQFLRGRFYNFRGQMIKHVYDSDNNIVRSIKKTASRKIAHYKYSNRDGEKASHRKHTNKINPRVHATETSKHKLRSYHGKSEVRPVENVTGNFSSQSDTILNPATPLVQRSMSAYSLRDYPKRKEIRAQSAASSTSLTNMSIKKFYDEHGRLLTGVYNSKTRLLGYSASGNARVLAPYLFDTKGNFVSGRYNLDRKPLKNIYDSSGKLVEKISKPILNKTKDTRVSKKSKGFKFHDLNGDEITSVYDLHGEKILDVTGSCEKIANLFDKNGNFKKNLYNYRGSELKVYDVGQEVVGRGSTTEDNFDRKEDEKDAPGSKGRFSVLSSFKDKILTVIFDNQHRLSQRLSPQTFKKKARQYMEGERGKKDADERITKRKYNLYDKNLNLIKDIYDERGKIISKLYNSDGEVIGELYSASGTLVKNNVLKNMFEKNVFTPKVFNSEGNLISAIYANRKLLKKVFDEHGGPAKVDSDLIYLVSDRSLPDDASPETSKSETKQVNYFSEGSSYPFPEGQNQNRQIKNQQLIEERDYEAEMEVAFNRYSRRRTDNCICEQCQKMGRNRNNIVQFGENILSRLSRFTLPLSKFLSGNFLRRYDSDEFEGDIDSLETLIDQARKTNACEGTEDSDKEYYSRSSSVLLESDENVPISRKMIERTLRNCVHLNSSTKVLGKVSDTVLQHFANLILQDIEQKFYNKLNVLQCGGSREDSCQAFPCDGENDICIGTELKFEDSLIGRHISAQTSEFPTSPGRCRICGSSMECLTENLDPNGYFDENSIGWDNVNNKAFVCKVPNLQPFIMKMKTKIEAFEKPVEGN